MSTERSCKAKTKAGEHVRPCRRLRSDSPRHTRSNYTETAMGSVMGDISHLKEGFGFAVGFNVG